MKKKIDIIFYTLWFIIILLIALCFCLYLRNRQISDEIIITNKKLAGKEISEGVYHYDLDIGDYNHNINIINGNIYYLVELENRYEFYKIDIYKNTKQKIGEFNSKDYYCYFDGNYIDCSNDNEKIIFNSNFKKIYQGKNVSIIPYKDNFFKYENNTLYLNNKVYKKIDKDLKGYNVYRYETFGDNLFIFFSNYDGDSYIYSVKEDKFEDYVYNVLNKHSNGLYFFDDDNIYVTYLNSDEITKYKNPIKESFFNANLLADNLLFYFSDDYLKVYNLQNEVVSLFDYRINKRVDKIFYRNGLLYLVTNDDVYIIKLDNISLKMMTIDRLEAELNSKIDHRIENIYNEYGVEVKIKNEADLYFEVFRESTEGAREFDVINDSLDYIEEVAKLFSKEFFNEFIHDEYTGFRIYLVSKINSDFQMSGEELKYYDKYVIIVDTSEVKRTICHEIMHALEDVSNTKDKNIFDKWEIYNPKGFKYTEEYDPNASPYMYSAENNEANVYFVDNYSQVNELEDKARILENILMKTDSMIKDNPYLLRKAKYLVEEIIKYYPMLKDIDMLNYYEK